VTSVIPSECNNAVFYIVYVTVMGIVFRVQLNDSYYILLLVYDHVYVTK